MNILSPETRSVRSRGVARRKRRAVGRSQKGNCRNGQLLVRAALRQILLTRTSKQTASALVDFYDVYVRATGARLKICWTAGMRIRAITIERHIPAVAADGSVRLSVEVLVAA